MLVVVEQFGHVVDEEISEHFGVRPPVFGPWWKQQVGDGENEKQGVVCFFDVELWIFVGFDSDFCSLLCFAPEAAELDYLDGGVLAIVHTFPVHPPTRTIKFITHQQLIPLFDY